MHISDSSFICTKYFKMYKNLHYLRQLVFFLHQVFLKLHFYRLKATMLTWCHVFENYLLEQRNETRKHTIFPCCFFFFLEDIARVLEG